MSSDLGFGVYPVTVVDHSLVHLKDGTQIAIRLWFPRKSLRGTSFEGCPSEEYKDGEPQNPKETYPCVMEYLPYRKSDWTMQRDHRRHPWISSHGYVVMRVDMRGSGDSGGFYFDEYTQVEFDDACEIIDWISKQSWSNGRVGMYGKSWGGFNGLQIAWYQPPALKAVISLYSTDNRYTDDMHHKGGCVLANGMLNWASVMFAWNARPPNPNNVAKWKEEWRKRLDHAGASWASTWLKHQSFDDYYKHGSICLDYDKVNIPILAIGGWHDGYTNAVFRLAENLPNCRAIIGPWSHEWPDIAVPGPNIGFMDECLTFWDQHLKDKPPAKIPAKFIWFQCSGEIPPGPSVQSWPGEWHQRDGSPEKTAIKYALADSGVLETGGSSAKQWRLTFNSEVGLSCGEWLSFGAPDLPSDQRISDGFGTNFETGSLDSDIDVFGFPKLDFTFQLENDNQGTIAARLCDVFPDGQSRLISYGVLNLNHLKGHENPEELEEGKEYPATLQLDSLGYRIHAGHRLQLCLSVGYWPQIWPPRCADLAVVVQRAKLTIPTMEDPTKTAAPGCLLETPRLGPELSKTVSKPSSFTRFATRGLSDRSKSITTVSDDGVFRIGDTQLSEVQTDICSIEGDDVLSAKTTCIHDLGSVYKMSTADPQDIRVKTHSEMTCDRDNFYLKNEVETFLQGEKFWKKSWEETVPRKFV